MSPSAAATDAPALFALADPTAGWRQFLQWGIGQISTWDWSAIVSAFATAVAAYIAWLAYRLAAQQLPLAIAQITGLRESLDIAGSANELEALARIVEVEKDVSEKRFQVELAEMKLERANSAGRETTREDIEALEDEFPILVDAYFRSLDRLAFCIRSGLLRGKDWKEQYHDRFKLDLTYYRESLGEHPLDTFPHLAEILTEWGTNPDAWGPVPPGNGPEQPPI